MVIPFKNFGTAQDHKRVYRRRPREKILVAWARIPPQDLLSKDLEQKDYRQNN